MILNQTDFAMAIEQIAKENKQTHVEAVLKYCSDNYIEPQEIVRMIDGPLKEKMRANFADMHMLPKSASFDI